MSTDLKIRKIHMYLNFCTVDEKLSVQFNKCVSLF